jgi:hypothetical protein
MKIITQSKETKIITKIATEIDNEIPVRHNLKRISAEVAKWKKETRAIKESEIKQNVIYTIYYTQKINYGTKKWMNYLTTLRCLKNAKYVRETECYLFFEYKIFDGTHSQKIPKDKIICFVK